MLAAYFGGIMKYMLSFFAALFLFFTHTQQDLEATMILMKTSEGDIVLDLNDEKAPITVKNFLQYVDSGFYNGTIFHRVINNFMIQGGGMLPDLTQKATQAAIKNEATNGLKNTRGTIAMARTNVVDSGTSQFFINVVDNAFLDHKGTSPQAFGYCVFGKVVEGMDVVDKIKGVKTHSVNMYQDVPVTPVTIISVSRK